MTTAELSTLRKDLVALLEGGQAFAKFSRIFGDVPPHARGVRVDGFEHSLWQLLEHIRIDQRDILDFCTTPEYLGLKPEEFWPTETVPPSDSAWEASVALFFQDLNRAKQLALDNAIDLFSTVRAGTSQTWLRGLMLIAEHNAHHLGQFVALRKILGVW